MMPRRPPRRLLSLARELCWLASQQPLSQRLAYLGPAAQALDEAARRGAPSEGVARGRDWIASLLEGAGEGRRMVA